MVAVPRRSFTRPSGFRDSRLIVIASEGSNTEPAYFEAVSDHLLARASRVHVEVLRREAGPSAPEYVIGQLDDFRKNWKLSGDDELWAVIDYDRWGEEKLSSIATSAVQKRYGLAVSRPCFEVWRLLHFEDMSVLPQPEQTALEQGGCRAVTARVRQACGSCNKNMNDVAEYLPLIDAAVERAERLDSNPQERWPSGVGTRVYHVLNSIR